MIYDIKCFTHSIKYFSVVKNTAIKAAIQYEARISIQFLRIYLGQIANVHNLFASHVILLCMFELVHKLPA